MKVAIIGAGLSGLACGLELKRHGIEPVIFEKTRILGDKPGYLVCTLRLFQGTVRSPMSMLKKKYGINIEPLYPLDEMVMVAPNKTVTTKGNHGFVFKKGTAEDSLEHQILAGNELNISFNSEVDVKDIRNNFDRIVVATGSGAVARDLGMWTTTFTAQCRIVTVSGSFKPNTLIIWLNKNYARDGYAYLVARNENEAEIVLTVSNIKDSLLEFYWNEFVIAENIRYPIIKSHNLFHQIGYPSTCQLDNIYLAGGAGGMVDDFLGFGASRSIESGILAARAIAHNLDYNKLLEPYIKEVKAIHEYRKMLTILKNEDYDRYMAILGIPGLKHALYNNPVYKAKHGILVPKAVTALKKKQYKPGYVK